MTKPEIEVEVSEFLATCSDSVEFDELVVFAQKIADKAILSTRDKADALCDRSYANGVRAGWNASKEKNDSVLTSANKMIREATKAINN